MNVFKFNNHNANLDKRDILLSFFLCLIVCMIALFSKIEGFPVCDSGVYGYVGSLIKESKMPYLYAWDNKAPMIYFIDFIGISLTPNSMLGIWIIELIFLTVSTFLMGIMLFRIFKSRYIAMCSLIMPAGVNLLGFVNCTEGFALLFNVCALFLFFSKNNNNKLRYLGIGFLTSLAFMTKQNNIGVFLTICILIMISSYRAFKNKSYSEIWQSVYKLTFMGLGFAVVPLLVLIYYYRINGIEQLVDAAFIANSTYSSVRSFLEKFIIIVSQDYFRGLIVFYIIMWALLFRYFLFNSKFREFVFDRLDKEVIIFALINFPIEFLMYGIQGRPYLHYVIMLLNITILLTAISFKTIKIWDEYCCFEKDEVDTTNKKRYSYEHYILASKSIIILCMLVYLKYNVLSFFTNCSDNFHLLFNNNFTSILNEAGDNYEETKNSSIEKHLAKRVIQETEPSDKVLIWGSVNGINFVTGRKSPVKYFYQIHLYLNGYTSNEKADEFLDEIKANKPKLIVDTKQITQIDPFGANFKRTDKKYFGNQFIIVPNLRKVAEYIMANYRKIEDNKIYAIYKIK